LPLCFPLRRLSAPGRGILAAAVGAGNDAPGSCTRSDAPGLLGAGGIGRLTQIKAPARARVTLVALESPGAVVGAARPLAMTQVP